VGSIPAPNLQIDLKVEGEPVKRYRVFRTNIDNNPYDCEGEYDGLAELRKHRWRADLRYKLCVARSREIIRGGSDSTPQGAQLSARANLEE
jgi:hypothetical protein